jgi:hypothetical protein
MSKWELGKNQTLGKQQNDNNWYIFSNNNTEGKWS